MAGTSPAMTEGKSRRLDAESAGAVERDVAGCDGGGPARRLGEPAESEEMRRDVAEAGPRAGERADDRVWRVRAEEVLGEPGIARERARRDRDAADRRKAQERRDRGRTRKPDADREIETVIAQARDEAQHRRGRECKLGDDVHRKPGRGRGL